MQPLGILGGVYRAEGPQFCGGAFPAPLAVKGFGVVCRLRFCAGWMGLNLFGSVWICLDLFGFGHEFKLGGLD